MLQLIFKLPLLIFVLQNAVCNETTCEESKKHFADLCFTPEPKEDFDFKWLSDNQPEDGIHVVQGNDIVRLHFSEALKGRHLSLHDNFNDTCFRLKVAHAQEGHDDGGLDGYGNLKCKWNCDVSKDHGKVFRCDVEAKANDTQHHYHEKFNFYTTFSDHKNIQVVVVCHPTGQVGWLANSVSKTLSNEEQEIIAEHIESIGFSRNDTVTLFNESCGT